MSEEIHIRLKPHWFITDINLMVKKKQACSLPYLMTQKLKFSETLYFWKTRICQWKEAFDSEFVPRRSQSRYTEEKPTGCVKSS